MCIELDLITLACFARLNNMLCTCQMNTQTGVYLSLKGTIYANNSVITITGIGTDSDNPSGAALQCITDLRPCCRQEGTHLAQQMLMGEWYFPDKTQVPGSEVPSSSLFRSRGLNDGRVNLFRTHDEVLSPVGLFCCEIPDATGVNRTLCADLSELTY